jgi:hypothetical protein
MKSGLAPKSLESGELRLTYQPELAGRVLEFSWAGQNVLSTSAENPINFGSTYWTSPQATWGWPPIVEIDSAPFDETSGRCSGPAGRLGATLVRLHKTFRVSSAGNSFDLIYELENVGSASVSVAGWEISRVLPGGITFFPTGDFALTPIAPHADLVLGKVGSLSYFDHRDFEPGLCRKVHADGREGFLAHVDRTRPVPLLFLKTFLDSAPLDQAPGEGEVEIFANDDGAYVEVEVQGRCVRLEPGQTNRLVVRWTLQTLDPRLAEAAALPELGALVREIAARVGTPS